MSFSYNYDTIYDKDTKGPDKWVPIYRVLYKDTCIAFFRIMETCVADAAEYVKTHGYMAEWRRQWNLGNKVSWDDSMKVLQHTVVPEDVAEK